MIFGNLGRRTAEYAGAPRTAMLFVVAASLLLTFFSPALLLQTRGPPLLRAADAQLSDNGTNYEADSLFIALLSGGDALVEYDVKIPNPQTDSTVALFGTQDFRDLIVADFNDKLIAYDLGPGKNQIILRSPSSADARISYSTQDLLNKTGKVWTFSIDSPIAYTLKLPANSVLTDTSGSEPPAIKTIGGQYLLTFNPGVSTVSYIIGVVGTESQASIVIKAADTTIREVKQQYSGIVLTAAEDMLKNATSYFAAGRFTDAESLAGKANDAAVTAGQGYSDAQSAISAAEQQIANASSQNRDTTAANALLQTSKDQFARGEYPQSKDSAEQATGAIGASSAGGSGNSNLLTLGLVVGAVAAAAGGGGFIVLRMRSRPPLQVAPRQSEVEPDSRRQIDVQSPERDGPMPDALLPESDPIEPALRTPSDKLRDTGPAEHAGFSDPVVRAPGTAAPESQTNPSVLARIVSRIIQEKPALRQEDRDVLSFLAEKEGAAFESEIRGKFQLPKTTIWRLVKRLEREDLVEIRKAGGQNLIKLRFEGRQQ